MHHFTALNGPLISSCIVSVALLFHPHLPLQLHPPPPRQTFAPFFILTLIKKKEFRIVHVSVVDFTTRPLKGIKFHKLLMYNQEVLS